MGSVDSPTWEDNPEQLYTASAHGAGPLMEKLTPVSTRNDVNSMPSSTLKKRKKLTQKRVISVPISHLDPSKQRGETPPPLDSWTWRKYGQKPIKGSPYPRGYYRCSSNKGCPARKQVERSRLDPSVLLVTYACDHNHPSSARNQPAASPDAGEGKLSPEEPNKSPSDQPAVLEDVDKFEMDYGELVWDDASWFSNIGEPTIMPEAFEISNGGDQISGWLHTDDGAAEDQMGGRRSGEVQAEIRDDDDDLFADLTELPESSVVFRRVAALKQEESRRCSTFRTDTVG